MEYGINITFFSRTLGLKRAAELIAKAGFTMLDYTPSLASEDWRKEAEEALAIFDANGLTVHQTHAPFNRYGTYGKGYAVCLERCAEVTELIGAKFMVAHGDEFDLDRLSFSPEAALDFNHNLFLPYVERARRGGYKVAFETVFEDCCGRRFTSRAEELMALICSFKSESAVCCWDFGHAHVCFREKMAERVKEFGNLIQCTHLHDNTGVDAHQLPLTGDINWKSVMSAFHEIGYSGILSVEYAHGNMPAHLSEDFIALSYKTAKYLWEI